MDTKEKYIAVFDSGVGGISVLRHLCRVLPEERFLYFGDGANAPYGTRPVEQIRELTFRAAEMLMERNIKSLVIACNTATAVAAAELRAKYPDTIIIGIEPALKPAADLFPGGTIGVMATPATLGEGKFARLLERCSDKCNVVKLPVPGLVELVEDGKANSEESARLLHGILSPYAGRLDAVVLGCTHYPFASDTISRILGKHTVLLDGGLGTAQHTKRRLEQANLLRSGKGEVLIENSLPDSEIIDFSYSLLESE